MQGGGTEVLLVEDDECLRDTLAEILRHDGYSVTVAESAEEGLEKLTSGHFGLVLTDYELPIATGAWMLREAVAAGLLADTGVLVITGHRNPAGTEGWKVLHKPLEHDTFLREVALAVTGAHS